MKDTIFIHYGHNEFNKSKFQNISNDGAWIKPKGGLWGSPINSSWGWKTWCKENNFQDGDFSIYFEFKLNIIYSNVLVINSYGDMLKLPWKNVKYSDKIKRIDFEEINRWYDAIYLTENGQRETHLPKFTVKDYKIDHFKNLYGWDCESVLVMNPNIIEELKNEKCYK